MSRESCLVINIYFIGMFLLTDIITLNYYLNVVKLYNFWVTEGENDA